MDYITTTQLRTETSRLIDALRLGKKVDLIHRSAIVGVIGPKKAPGHVITKEDISRLRVLATRMNLPKLSYKEREKRLRTARMAKYGKHFL